MMRYFTQLALLLTGLALGVSAAAATLVQNIQGYTMDGGRRVSFVGLEFEQGVVTRLYATEDELKASRAEERIDGQGATVLPGLIDAHGHVTSLGRALSTVDLVGSDSEADSAARVSAFIGRNPGLEWVTGRGWNQVLWPDKRFPDRRALDAVSGERAVALQRIDGHAMWANSKALQLAGIGQDTADPEGGEIIRDSSGRATGVLIDNAMNLVFDVMPPVTDSDMARYALVAMQDLARNGVTSVHDAGIKAQEVRAYQSLRERDAMPIRIYAMLDVEDPANDAYLRQGPIIDPEHRFDIRSVKISADGALGSRGAALFEDYSDQPGQRGLLLVNDEQLDHHMGRSMAAGYQVNIHAIGDRANARVLDFMETMIRKYDNRALRHRNEHAQIIRIEDIPRFAEIGVVHSADPRHQRQEYGRRPARRRATGGRLCLAQAA